MKVFFGYQVHISDVSVLRRNYLTPGYCSFWMLSFGLDGVKDIIYCATQGHSFSRSLWLLCRTKFLSSFGHFHNDFYNVGDFQNSCSMSRCLSDLKLKIATFHLRFYLMIVLMPCHQPNEKHISALEWEDHNIVWQLLIDLLFTFFSSPPFALVYQWMVCLCIWSFLRK